MLLSLISRKQGCQVAVVTAPLLKSSRRKTSGAVKNPGPWGAVKGPWKGQKGTKVAVEQTWKKQPVTVDQEELKTNEFYWHMSYANLTVYLQNSTLDNSSLVL
jgi:hypothetical protein